MGQVYYSVNDQWGNKVLFIIVHYRAVKVITEMHLCSKTKWPLVPAACFCSVTFCLWITTD